MKGAQTLWRIGADTPTYTADDLSGKGAENTGGRWNREGRPVVYASLSIALACLETVVHLNQAGLPMNRYLVEITVPPETWKARASLPLSKIAVGWDALPHGKVSLDAGDAWLTAADTPLLLVPSVIVPEEFNVLINPRHPLVKTISARKIRKWVYDQRIRDTVGS